VKEEVSQKCNSADRVSWDWLAIFFRCSDVVVNRTCYKMLTDLGSFLCGTICWDNNYQYSIANLLCKLKTSLLAHKYFWALSFLSLRKPILSLREKKMSYIHHVKYYPQKQNNLFLCWYFSILRWLEIQIVISVW